MPACSSDSIQYAAGFSLVTSPIAALIALRSALRRPGDFHSSLDFHSERSIASQNRFQRLLELAAILMWPSLDGNTPIGKPVGRPLPAGPGASPFISQR